VGESWEGACLRWFRHAQAVGVTTLHGRVLQVRCQDVRCV
jgi:hypothetical protein